MSSNAPTLYSRWCKGENRMKKYIITQDFLDMLKVHTPTWLSDMLEDLKPIEPLDNPTIKSIMVGSGFKTYPEVGDDLKPYCYAAVRAIERHIVGETE